MMAAPYAKYTAKPAIPPKPSAAATIAIIKNMIAYLNINVSLDIVSEEQPVDSHLVPLRLKMTSKSSVHGEPMTPNIRMSLAFLLQLLTSQDTRLLVKRLIPARWRDRLDLRRLPASQSLQSGLSTYSSPRYFQTSATAGSHFGFKP